MMMVVGHKSSPYESVLLQSLLSCLASASGSLFRIHQLIPMAKPGH